MVGNGAPGAVGSPRVTSGDDREVRRAHETLVGGGALRSRTGVRRLVADSWRRSLAAGLSADAPTPPTALATAELGSYRTAHPLAAVMPMLVDVIGQATRDCDALLAVTDEAGRLLWVHGATSVLRRAERINFAAGAWWDEAHAGTNAPALALRLHEPVAIRAAEHFARPVQTWSCVAVPIHAPGDGHVLGVVDVTGGDRVVDPACVAMVRAAARMAEAELGRLALLTRPTPTAPFTGPVVLRGLGRDQVLVGLPGRPDVELSPRHSEIVVVLADRPDGVTGEELTLALYPESVRHATSVASTVRAELVRLRGILGPDVLASRPYRLAVPALADWQLLGEQVARGDVAGALQAYAGPLLPHSQSPDVERARHRLDSIVRRAVLASGDARLLVGWTRARWGADDVEAWHALRRHLPSTSPLRPVAAAEVERLEAELA